MCFSLGQLDVADEVGVGYFITLGDVLFGKKILCWCLYCCYIPSTSSTRNADTVEFFPKHFDFPRTTNSTYLRQAAKEIISILSI